MSKDCILRIPRLGTLPILKIGKITLEIFYISKVENNLQDMNWNSQHLLNPM